MNRARVMTLIGKELREFRANPAAILPVLVVVALCTVVPFVVVIVIPKVIGQSMATDHNLQRIIDKVKARNPNVRVLIAGMQLPNYAADDYVSSFGEIFGDLASKNGAALVPYLLQGVAGDPAMNLSDGIHPNVAGQKILAETVWEALQPAVREVATLSSRGKRATSATKSGSH